MPERKEATCPAGTEVARKLSVQQSYPDSALQSMLAELITGFLIMATNANLDPKDRSLAWSWFDQVMRRYVEVRHA